MLFETVGSVPTYLRSCILRMEVFQQGRINAQEGARAKMSYGPLLTSLSLQPFALVINW